MCIEINSYQHTDMSGPRKEEIRGEWRKYIDTYMHTYIHTHTHVVFALYQASLTFMWTIVGKTELKHTLRNGFEFENDAIVGGR
jgi:hypothetical protein